MLAAGVDRCPNCTGRLDDGAPIRSCPLCGLEFDEHSRVWQSSESWARLGMIYAAVGLIVGLVVALLYRFTQEHVPNPALALILAILAPAIGLPVRRVLGGRISGRFVALTSQGVVVGTRSQPVLVPWDDFERLIERKGILRIQRRSDPTPIALDDVFASAREAGAFENEVRMAARRYGSTDDGAHNPSN